MITPLIEGDLQEIESYLQLNRRNYNDEGLRRVTIQAMFSLKEDVENEAFENPNNGWDCPSHILFHDGVPCMERIRMCPACCIRLQPRFPEYLDDPEYN